MHHLRVNASCMLPRFSVPACRRYRRPPRGDRSADDIRRSLSRSSRPAFARAQRHRGFPAVSSVSPGLLRGIVIVPLLLRLLAVAVLGGVFELRLDASLLKSVSGPTSPRRHDYPSCRLLTIALDVGRTKPARVESVDAGGPRRAGDARASSPARYAGGEHSHFWYSPLWLSALIPNVSPLPAAAT